MDKFKLTNMGRPSAENFNSIKSIFTIGYQGRTAENLIERIFKEGVRLLIDVRYRPLSRKRGLSKTALSTKCIDHGIEYYHDRNLGTPPEIMKKFRETGQYDWIAYRSFLERQNNSLEIASKLAEQQTACLLCYEADPMECHRRLVANEISRTIDLETIHLR